MPKSLTLASFLKSLLILTAVSLIVRIVSLRFHLILREALGNGGIGLLSLMLSIRGFAVTFASAGISLAASRLSAQALEHGGEGARGVMRRCLLYSTLMGGVAAIGLNLLAPALGDRVLHSTAAIPAMRIMALSLPFLSASSAMGGYFQAVRRAGKSAFCDLAELFLRMGLTLFLLDHTASPYLAVVVGMTVGEILSSAWQGLLFVLDQHRYLPKEKGSVTRSASWRPLLRITLPIALSSYVRSGLLTLEHLLIPRGLRQSSMGKEQALARYGTVSSLVFPLILLPATPLYAANSLLIPEIARAQEAGDRERLTALCRRTFSVLLPYSIGIATGILCLAPRLGVWLAGEETAAMLPVLSAVADRIGADHSFVTPTAMAADLRALAPLIPVMYLDSAADAMLKGLGDQVFCMGVNIADAILSIGLVALLLPALGIRGYILTLIISELFNATLSLTRLLSRVPIRIRYARQVLLPLAIGTAVTCIYAFL